MRSDWIVVRAPRSARRLRVFCFPHAGAGPSVYHGWSEHLTHIEVCAVQAPGRESRWRERPTQSVRDLASAVAAAIAPLTAEPYAVFGHSVGAVVAFETARALRAAGKPLPRSLAVSAARAPHVLRPEPPVAHLPDREFVDTIARRHDGIPADVAANAELLEIVLPALRADIQMLEQYRYASEAPLSVPIVAFAGTRDAVPVDEVDRWREQTDASFALELIDAGHFFVKEHAARLVTATVRAAGIEDQSPSAAAITSR